MVEKISDTTPDFTTLSLCNTGMLLISIPSANKCCDDYYGTNDRKKLINVMYY